MAKRIGEHFRGNVIAYLALFVALGGSAYAVTALDRNSVRSRHIVNGQVRSLDVRDNGLTGRDIRESSLGTVPNASELAGAKAVRIGRINLTDDQERTVAAVGPFTFTARCRIDVSTGIGNLDIAEILIDTSQNNSAFEGDASDNDFDAAESPGQFVFVDNITGLPVFEQESRGAAIAPDGTEIVGSELYAGIHVLGNAGVCRFGGFFYVD